MREALVSIFGQDGAVVVQYIVTFLIILALVGGALWLGRRYAGGRVNVAGRGRLPRLAVIDALSVDKRRRLVLVRRDNVEHLLLIGGPSDIVVEPSITRARVSPRPGQVADRAPNQPAIGAPQPAPPPPPHLQRTAVVAALRARALRASERPEPAATEEPIPFPPRRSQAREPEPRQTDRPSVREEPKMVAAPVAPPPREAPSALRDEPGEPEPPYEPRRVTGPTAAHHAPPLRPEPPAVEPSPLPVIRPLPSEEPAELAEERDITIAEVATPSRKSAFAPPAGSGHAAALPAAPEDDPRSPREEPKRPPPPGPRSADDDDADAVSNLEKDMARLLGQISNSGSS
ncbi:MAG: flagellar biosynthetic protein FliO [Bauldia sp.]|uniref:flagellar biosynthetic protein FliO n=1 Tax=Bauldia sp. TaxID=2575872 RepID=UPI001D9E4D44|nr:flagellar biosynthetic protein FliO [Bauldia sp.]MCB1485994.1 flagellar biosynthetic protein FliO [Bauldia sp.]MCB1496734.1 flagellar biosynthetic protein FliO [Bauldia sp.]